MSWPTRRKQHRWLRDVAGTASGSHRCPRPRPANDNNKPAMLRAPAECPEYPEYAACPISRVDGPNPDTAGRPDTARRAGSAGARRERPASERGTLVKYDPKLSIPARPASRGGTATRHRPGISRHHRGRLMPLAVDRGGDAGQQPQRAGQQSQEPKTSASAARHGGVVLPRGRRPGDQGRPGTPNCR